MLLGATWCAPELSMTPLHFERHCANDRPLRAKPLLGGLALGQVDGDGAPPTRAGLPPLAGLAGCVDGWFTDQPTCHGQTGTVRWRADGNWLFGSVASDLAAGADTLQTIARTTYADIFETLRVTGMPELLRVWNFIPDIHAEHAGLERYRQFNLGRQDAFLAARRDVMSGSPAASALGRHTGPFTVDFLAGKTAGLTLENPRQTPAWQYPQEFGPRSPTFSRALLLPTAPGHLTLCISGTASIVGHASQHLGDAAAQTTETLRNLQALIEVANANGQARFCLQDLACTVYVRHPQDLDRVRHALEACVGPQSPAAQHAIYLRADICRAELLMEIEAHAVSRGQLLRT